MSFTFTRLSVPGLVLAEPAVFGDPRGFFMEVFKESEFQKIGLKRIVQINHSRSQKNVLRGLHYQLNPKAQAKLVRVLLGEIFDVAVDIRCGSPTYGKWEGMRLSGDDKRMLYIPEGFAHGFCVLSDAADVEYACTGEYSPTHDRGIMWNDQHIKIEWPVKDAIVSDKDQKHPGLDEAEKNFVYKPSFGSLFEGKR